MSSLGESQVLDVSTQDYGEMSFCHQTGLLSAHAIEEVEPILLGCWVAGPMAGENWQIGCCEVSSHLLFSGGARRDDNVPSPTSEPQLLSADSRHITRSLYPLANEIFPASAEEVGIFLAITAATVWSTIEPVSSSTRAFGSDLSAALSNWSRTTTSIPRIATVLY